MPTAPAPRGLLTELLLKDETTYGTAATGNYQKTLVYEDSLVELSPLEDDPVLGTARNNARDMTQPVSGLRQGVTGNLVAPLDLNHSWFWLKGAFGAPVSTGSNPDYQHVFTSGDEVLPHRTIEGKRKSDVFLQRTGCLVASIAGEMSRRGGFDRMTVDILGRKETNLAATGGGTPPTILDRDPLPAVLPVLKIDGVAVADVISLSWTYNNGATPQDYLGDVAGYPTGHDLDAPASFSGTLRARFRSSTLYDLARAGTSFAMELLWQRAAARSLSIAAPLVRFDPVGLPVTGPGRIEQTFNFRAEQSDTLPMLTITLKNALAAAAYA
jgi:hypothetical protein